MTHRYLAHIPTFRYEKQFPENSSFYGDTLTNISLRSDQAQRFSTIVLAVVTMVTIYIFVVLDCSVSLPESNKQTNKQTYWSYCIQIQLFNISNKGTVHSKIKFLSSFEFEKYVFSPLLSTQNVRFSFLWKKRLFGQTQIYVRTDGQKRVDGQTYIDRWTDGKKRVDGRTWTDGWKRVDGRTQIDGRINLDEQTDRHIDRQIDGQIDKQIDAKY